MAIRILGIDPGLAHTGWAVIECSGSRSTAVAYGVVSTKPSQPLPERLAAIHAGIVEAIAHYHPAECAIEDVFFGVNARSAFALGQARGVAILAAASGAGEPLLVGEYTPTQVKQSVVGEGHATKEQIGYMVRTILSLDHTPSPEHCADALAVALTHSALRVRRTLEAGGGANGSAPDGGSR